MNSTDQALLARIEQDLLDDGVPTSSILRKCMILGGKAKSSDLLDWARRELYGYDPGEDLPRYRVVGAALVMRVQSGLNVFTQELGPEQVPAEAREWGYGKPLEMRQSLDVLEKTVTSTNGQSLQITSPSAPRVVGLLNKKIAESDDMTTVLSVYWNVPVAAFQGVIGGVRTALTEFLSELLASMPDGAADPSNKQVEQAVRATARIVISGNQAPVTVVTSNAGDGGHSAAIADLHQPPDEDDKTFWQRLRNRGAVVAAAQIIGALAGCAAIYLTIAVVYRWWPFLP